MKTARILFRNQEAGILTQHDDGSFTFKYNSAWINDRQKQSISLTLPKRIETYQSNFLFPFFYNMLPEGSNKQVVCKYNRIDLDDYFSLLMITAGNDTVGAVRIIKVKD